MSETKFDVAVEQRIGLVMYGGISLAIYMNGVAQEFLNLVLSTAHDENGESLLSENVNLDGQSQDARSPITGVQRVYREMARIMVGAGPDDLISTKFVVDIMSGTSAGGLNAMFLGKSIADKVSLKPLQNLWVEEGDIAVLLDDKESYKGLLGLPRKPARSLLSSRRMYAKLIAAFDQMEQLPLFTGFKASRTDIDLCTELDVYMTATDLQGRPTPIYLGALDFVPHIGDTKPGDNFEKIQLEPEHKAAFHFRYESKKYFGDKHEFVPSNDFAKEFIPFLAFVGRCTSSIVPAFEPMRLKDAEQVLNSTGHRGMYTPETWKGLFRQYWGDASLYDSGTTALSRRRDFEYRCFGDGGYLDNKPFGYAFKQLSARKADVAVKRNVFYVEPHPDDNSKILLETMGSSRTVPNVFEHASLAKNLPSVQNISERVIAIRQQGEYASRVMQAVQLAVRNAKTVPKSPTPGAGPYENASPISLRMNYESMLDNLAVALVMLLGFDADTAMRPALRLLLDAAFECQYKDLHDNAETMKKVLNEFDVARRRRLIEWLRRRYEKEIVKLTLALPTQFVAAADSITDNVSGANEQTRTQEVVSDIKGLSQTLGEFFAPTNIAICFRKASQGMDLLRDILESRPADKRMTEEQLIKQLIDDIKGVKLDGPEAELAKNLILLQISISELVYIMGAKRDAENQGQGIDGQRRTRAKQVIGTIKFPPKIQKQIDELFDNDFRVREKRSSRCIEILEATKKILNLEIFDTVIGKWASDHNLGNFVNEFYAHDDLEFPLMYPAGLGDSYALDIVRISPKDAGSLEPDRSSTDNRVNKLSGIELGHFGGFFTRSGRILDIVWGRLDTTEVILNTYLQPDQVAQLLPKAQLAILGESLAEFADEIGIDERENTEKSRPTLRTRLENLVGVVMTKHQLMCPPEK